MLSHVKYLFTADFLYQTAEMVVVETLYGSCSLLLCLAIDKHGLGILSLISELYKVPSLHSPSLSTFASPAITVETMQAFFFQGQK